ncbi:hypothetical protein BC629DRAFT_690575 [Irpex lacteus]|nr:hypothetical protein BC629DRAFT_690575 [Irpex lacteus]
MITTAKFKAERASQAAKPLPRLMAVLCTFTPSLADELSISIGEPVMLLEEYEDEWCLVQRVGKSDAERGVVPRFCLQEAPTLPTVARPSVLLLHLSRRCNALYTTHDEPLRQRTTLAPLTLRDHIATTMRPRNCIHFPPGLHRDENRSNIRKREGLWFILYL